MFNTPYETTACSTHVVTPILNEVKHALVSGDLKPAVTLKGKTLEGVYTIPSYLKGISPFFHPVLFTHNGKQVAVIDTRAFLKTGADGMARITSPNDYEFMLVRAALSLLWNSPDSGPGDQMAIADFAGQVFCRWVPETLVRRLSLDPMHQQTLVTLSGLFFFSQFSDAPLDTEQAQLHLAQRVARLTRVPIEAQLEILRDTGAIRDILGFVDVIKQKIASPRIEQLNAGLVVTSIGASWFGAASREVAAVALEYPPYLAAMLYSGITDRSYRNTPINKLAESVDRAGAARDYALSVARLIEELTHG